MAEQTNRTEIYLRFSRRSMIVVFFLGLTLGTFGLAIALQPAGDIAHALERAAWMIPVAIVICVAALRTTLRRHGWDPKSEESKAILNDEWRQANLGRAMRWTLGLVLLVQAPLAIVLALFTDLPARQAVSAMAIATVMVGLTAMSGLFFWLDRD